MSQSATFYPIDSGDFAAVKHHPNNLDLLSDRNNYVSFQGTHEGLRFVLSKCLSGHESNLVNEIFYPTLYIGEIAQTVFPNEAEAQEFVNITDNEDGDDFEREPITYHEPEKVRQIAFLLNNISNEQLLAQFNSEELNREGIYPWCWNSSQDGDQAYNERHLLADFQNLKELFNSASVTNSYLLCFVG
jgi:hypothetical protein